MNVGILIFDIQIRSSNHHSTIESQSITTGTEGCFNTLSFKSVNLLHLSKCSITFCYLLQRSCMRQRIADRIKRSGCWRRRQSHRCQRSRVQFCANQTRVKVHHHQASTAAEFNDWLVCRYLQGPVLCLRLQNIVGSCSFRSSNIITDTYSSIYNQ